MYKLCKTEQSALRQRELERKLAEMMNLVRYEQISVSDFCGYAEIPRKAFYRYFSSKDGALYALLDHTMLELEYFRDPSVPDSGKGLLLELEAFFRFWKDQKQLLDALEYSGISGILMERAISNLEETIVQRVSAPGEDERMRGHVLRFAICGLMIMMVEWHHSGYSESVSDMAKIAARLISQPMLPVIRDVF